MGPTSQHFTYRKLEPSDFSDYLKLYTDEQVMKHITGRALSEKEAKTRFQNNLRISNDHPDGMGFLMVKDELTSEFIGLVKFTLLNSDQAEIGYSLLPKYWGKNLASEIVGYFKIYTTSIPQIKELIGIVKSNNSASARVLVKNGFKFLKREKNENGEDEHYGYLLNQANSQ